MSNVIDERIVRMIFDNKSFEKNIATTENSINDFKKSLNFSGVTKGFESITKAAGQVSFNGITSGIDGVASKFSALEALTFGFFARIGTAAFDTGKKLVEALTIDPVKTGFKEYETQINAIQTILANTSSAGTTLEDVNKSLDELNEYADRTIYNFTQMTHNIGTFTAAGVDLETATKAIKGIANLAAVSGSSSEQASRVMYQLSQAIAAGKVNLQDWNSVVNAGMGGKIFQNALLDTAEAMGIAVDRTQNFRESISSKDGTGWLTSDVLLKTLEQFTGDMTESELAAEGYTESQIADIIAMGKTANSAAQDVKTFTQLWQTMTEFAQSGWTQSWELVIGDFEEAKKLLTSISKAFEAVLGPSIEARNSVLKFWHDMGGREKIINAISNAFEALKYNIQPFANAFREVFPKITGQKLMRLSVIIEELSEKLKFSTRTMGRLQVVAKGVFYALDIVKEVLKSVFKILAPNINSVNDFFDMILSELTTVSRYVIDFRNNIVENDSITKWIENLLAKIKTFAEKVKAFFAPLVSAFIFVKDFVSKIAKTFSDAFESITGKTIKDSISEALDWIKEKFTSAVDTIKALFSGDFGFNKITEKLGPLIEQIKGLFSGIFGKKTKNEGSIAELAPEKESENLIDRLSFLLDWVKKIGEAIGNTWASISKNFNADKAIELLSIVDAIIASLAFADIQRITGSIAALPKKAGKTVDALTKTVKSGQRFIDKLGNTASKTLKSVSDFINTFRKKEQVKIIKTIAQSMLMLAASLLIISFIDVGKLSAGFLAIIGLMEEMMLIVERLAASLNTKMALAAMTAAATVFSKLSIAILIMSVAIAILASQDIGAMWSAVGAVVVLMGALAAMAYVLPKFMKFGTAADAMRKSSLGFVLMSVSVLILASAVKKLAKLDIGAMWSAVGAVVVLMGALMLMAYVVDGRKIVMSSIGLILMSIATSILADSVKKLIGVDWAELGFASLVLIALIGFLSLVSNSMNKNMAGAIGLLLMSIAIDIVANSVKKLTEIDFYSLAAATIVLIALFGFMSLVSNSGKGSVKGATALIIMAVAMAIVAKAIKSIAELDWMQLGFAAIVMIALIGFMSMISGIVGANITGIQGILLLASAMITMASALTMLSKIETKALIVGMVALIAMLVVFGVAAALMAPIVPQMLLLGAALIVLSGAFILFAAGVLMLAVALAMIAATGTAAALAIVAMVSAIFGVMPIVVEKVFDTIIMFLEKLREMTPILIDLLIEQLVLTVDILINKLPEIIAPIVDALVTFWDKYGDDIMNGIALGFQAFVTWLSEKIPIWWNAFVENWKLGWAELKDGLKTWWDNFRTSFKEGWNSFWSKVGEWITTKVNNLKEDFIEGGKMIIEGIKEGLEWMWENSLAGRIVQLGKDLYEKFMGAIDSHSPSRLFMYSGKMIPEGIAEGIRKTSKDAVRSVENLGMEMFGAFSPDLFSSLDSLDVNPNPVITPVMDLSSVRQSAATISNLFSSQARMSASVNSSLVSDTLKYRDLKYQNSTYTDDNVIGAINELGSKFDSMNDNMMNTNIYLDTGALVGATVGPMDGALGRRAQRTKRGG